MKKIIILSGLLAATLVAVAQEGEYDDKKKKKTDIQFSVMGGIDLSGINGDSDKKGMLPGAQFGVRFSILNLSDVVSIQAGAEYSMQGGKYEVEGEGEPGSMYPGGTGKTRLNYLNFPVVARYQGESGFFAEAGVQPGVLLSAKDKFAGYTTDLKDYLNKFDMGVVAGGGYRFKNNFGIGARITPGLLNINKKQGNYEVNKDRNFVMSVRASYTF